MAGLNDVPDTALIRLRLRESIDIARQLLDSPCIAAAALVAARIVAAVAAGGKVLFFGNGGSAMDAGHLAAELVGRFYYDRRPLPALSLADHTAALTAIANDYDYDEVFARQVRGLGRPGDVLVGLTTSGDSANVVRALAQGRELGMVTVVLTGAKGGRVAEVVDICVKVPTTDTPRVQEFSLHLGHTICELVEAALLSDGGRPAGLGAGSDAQRAGGPAGQPPVPPAHQRYQRGDQDRADHGRVEQDAHPEPGREDLGDRVLGTGQ